MVSSTNLTGATVANLDDDPDAPDANWATATSVAAVDAAAFGPVPSETLTQLGGFVIGSVQGTLICAR